jgi:Flp pilus assembly protein TadD
MDISQLNSTADTLASILSSQKAQREQVAQYALARGLSFLQEKKYDRAVSEFKRATAFNPELPEAYEYLGKVYQTTGKTDEAIEIYKKGVQQNPTSEKAITSLGNAYVENKQYAEAETQFKKLAQVSPTSPYPYNTLGHIYLLTNRYEEAEGQFKKVIKLAPKDANGYYGLGLAYNKENKFGEAVGQFENAITLKKDFADAYSDLGYAYIGLGNSAKAEEQVKVLGEMGTAQANGLAQELELTLFTPKLSSVKPLESTFPSVLGPRTPVSLLDPALQTPNQSKTFSLTFQFNQAMDISSVQNSLNWFIFKASGGQSGLYNNGITVQPEKEILLSPIPISVGYDSQNYKATVFFSITQNSSGDGVIDPSHWVFKFKGTDISGNMIDSSGDEYDGFALAPF